MVVTLGQQYNVGEKPTVILYTYINRHAVGLVNVTLDADIIPLTLCYYNIITVGNPFKSHADIVLLTLCYYDIITLENPFKSHADIILLTLCYYNIIKLRSPFKSHEEFCPCSQCPHLL